MKKVFLSSIRRDAKRLGIDITAFLDNSDNYTIEELNFVRKQLENAVFLVEASINSLKVLEQKTPQHLPNPSNRLSGKPSLPKWGDDLLPPYGNGYK